MLKRKCKKLLALLMTLALVLGMLPLSAMADAAYGGTDQVVTAGGTNYYNSKGEPVGAGDKDKIVDVSKTVTQISENRFKVDLDVKTSMNVEEIKSAKDTAVVLVMDVSGSMDYREREKCPTCGGPGFHQRVSVDGKRVDCPDKSKPIPYETRLEKAKTAALSFLETYRGSGLDDSKQPIASRFVCVVKFSTEGNRVQDWVDVTTSKGYTDATAAINKLTHGGDTNIEAGLLLARNNLLYNNAKLINRAKEPINSHYVVLLTDGEATENAKGNQDTELTDCSYINGKSLEDEPKDWAVVAADRVKGTSTDSGAVQSKATLYTVACGSAETKWLKESIASNAQTALDASNIDTLNAAFIRISNSITKMAQAWVVTDPMGDAIAYNEGSITAVNNSTAHYDAEKNAIVWDLKEQPAGGRPDLGESTYHMSYIITLDNIDLNGSTAPRATDKGTTLSYVIVDGSGVPTSDVEKPYLAEFQQPTVKSLFGDLKFGKISHHTVGETKQHIPLEGATFTLTHDKDCVCGLNAPPKGTFTATSTVAGGKSLVSFASIPSGHTFVLQETQAPEGYVVDLTTYAVSVAQEKTTVNDETWSQDKTLLENRLDAKNVDVTVTKLWQDEGNTALRPETLAVTLNGSNNSKIEVGTWAKGDFVWTATVSAPTVDPETGNPIGYTAEETVPSGYTAENNGTATVAFADGSGSAALTNALNAVTDVNVSKTWLAPDSEQKAVEVQLTRGDTVVGTTTLNSANGWESKFTDVPVYEDGKNITGDYIVVETTKLSGFDDPTVTGSFANGFTVTNRISQQSIDITVFKQWVDGGSRLSDKPVLVTLTGSDGETYSAELKNDSVTFSALPKYDDQGQEIVYTASDSVEGYTSADAVVSKDKDGNYTATLTNTRADITDTIDIAGIKLWDDEENANNTRPSGEQASLTLTLQKLGDNAWIDVATATIAPEAVEQEDGSFLHIWPNGGTPFDFGKQPQYTAAGAAIAYQVVESTTPNNYTASVGTDANGYTITNTLDSGENGDKISVTVTKTWVDPYTDETRAEAGIEAEITLTGSNGFTGYLTTSANNATLTFMSLPKYDNGKLVTYTVSEKEIAGYQSVTPVEANADSYSVAITNKIAQATHEDIVVTKVWDDQLTDTTKRPSIEITLVRSDNEVIAATSSNPIDADTVAYTFSGLDTYNPETGARYTYAPQEIMTGDLSERYTKGISDDSITNTFKNETLTSISGVKTWILPQGAEIPSADVEISLYRDNALVGSTGITEGENGQWTYTFDGQEFGLSKYDPTDGHEYQYTVEETKVPTGFTSTLLADGRTFTNTSKELSTTVNYTVNKTWVGPEAQRPASVTVQLYNTAAPGTAVGTYDLVAGESWGHVFKGLDKYDQNRDLIRYAVREAGVENGEVKLNGLTYAVTAESSAYATTLTNTVLQATDITVAGEKIWAGLDETSKFTPVALQVQLYADSQPVVGQIADVNSESWAFSFETLPKYALPDNSIVPATDGHEIVYSVKEIGGTSGTTVFYQDGTYYYFDVTGGQGDSYNLTNTLRDTEQYQYVVNAVYATYEDGNLFSAAKVGLKGPISTTKDATPTYNDVYAKANATYNEITYTYDETNANNKPSLVKGELSADKVAEIVLYYRLDKTTTTYKVQHAYTLDGSTTTVPGGTFSGSVGDEINVAEIISATNPLFGPVSVYDGTPYSYTGVTHDKLVLGATADGNVITFSYSYTTPTYQVTVKHVNLTDSEAIIAPATTTHKITENPVTAKPLNAETGLPEGYKLVSWDSVTPKAGDSQPITFDENGVASINGSSNDSFTITYSYGPAANVAVKINYYVSGDDTFKPLRDSTVLSIPTYTSYDVAEHIYRALGQDSEYSYLSDSASGVYVGKTGTGDIEINVFYQAQPFPYKLVFHNDYTNANIETVYTEAMSGAFGAVVTADDVATALGSASANWQTSRLPSGYNLGRIDYPTIAFSAPATQNGETQLWDAANVTNQVVVHYTYTAPTGGDDDDDRLPVKPVDPKPSDPEIVIPPEDVPLAEIPDEDIPLAALPAPSGKEEDFLIVDEATPLGSLPQTGSRADAHRGLFPFTFGALAAMAGALLIGGKKREEDK